MKLTVRQIAEAIQTVLSGTRASNYREGGDEYRILVQVKDADQMALREILDLTLANSAEVEAIIEYRKALLALYRLDGSILPRWGIKQ